MDNGNKGIGDYIAVALLSAIIGFDKFDFDWFGLKAILFTNLVIICYAVLVYIVTVIAEKFKR